MIVEDIKAFQSEENWLTYTTIGDPKKPAVLLVHGWLGSRLDWRLTVPFLSDAYYCVIPDLLGHGDSDKPPQADYSIEAQAQRIVDMADAFGLEKFYLFGHSMGGMIVLNIAARLVPERILGMVNLAGMIDGRMPLLRPLLSLAEKSPETVYGLYDFSRLLANSHAGKQLLAAFNYYDLSKLPMDFESTELYYAVQDDIEIPAYRSLAAIEATNLTPFLSQISCPVLSIYGKGDRLVPYSQAELAEKEIKDHRLVILPNCGHRIMEEKLEESHQAILEFLNSLNGRPS